MNIKSAQQASLSEKFLNNIVITIIARATILAAPAVMAFVMYVLMNVYSNIETTLQVQGKQIADIQDQLQDHQFRLDTCKQARSDFQQSTMSQFTKLDTQLADIAAKITLTNNAVIRVQTIIETRFPPKEGFLLNKKGY